MSHARLSTLVFAGLAATGLLAACGSGGSAEEEAASATAKKAVAKPAAPRLVKAAGRDDPGVPVGVAFDLKQRPVPGQPFEVLIEITPTAELAQLSARVESGGGLDVRGGSNLPIVPQPAVGTPVQHVITAVAEADGVYTLNVLVSGPPGPSGEPGRTRSFLIPVIAGAGVAGAEPRPAEAASAGETASAGEAAPASSSAGGVPRRAAGQ